MSINNDNKDIINIPDFYIEQGAELIKIPDSLKTDIGMMCSGCQTCQNPCQASCQYSCMTGYEECSTGCQSTCEVTCLACQTSCLGCQTTCEKSCQCSNQGCQACQSACEVSVQGGGTASIEITGASEYSISARLVGLDTRYPYSNRTMSWTATTSGGSSGSASGTIGAYASSSSTVTMSGLTPDKSYTITCVISGITGVGSVTLSTTAWTLKLPVYAPDKPASIWVSSKTQTSITVSWDYTYNTDEWRLYLNGSYHGRSGVQTSYTFTGLDYNFSYYMCVTSYNLGGESGATCISAYPEQPPPPDPPLDPPSYINVTATGINFITVSWASVTDANRYALYLNGVHHIATPSTSFKFENLQPNTQYNICVASVRSSGQEGSTRCATGKTLTLGWNWEYEIKSGGAFYSQSGKTAYLMRAEHWNDFTKKINEVRVYKGLSSYSFTQAVRNMSSADVINCINQAINAINGLGFSMSTINVSTNVSASIFNNMVSSLNSIT